MAKVIVDFNVRIDLIEIAEAAALDAFNNSNVVFVDVAGFANVIRKLLSRFIYLAIGVL